MKKKTIQEFLHSLPEKEYFEILNSIRVQILQNWRTLRRILIPNMVGKTYFLKNKKQTF